MARIIAGVTSSHVPAIGAAIDNPAVTSSTQTLHFATVVLKAPDNILAKPRIELPIVDTEKLFHALHLHTPLLHTRLMAESDHPPLASNRELTFL